MKESTIEIDDYKVTIKELKIKTVKRVLENAKDIFDDPNLDIKKFITDKYDLAIDLCADLIIMPEGMEIDDLSFSDLDLIIPVLKEVNASFLDKLGMMQSLEQIAPALVPDTEIQSEDSTEV